MFVAQYMTSPTMTVTEDASARHAGDLIRQGGFHQLPVVDGNGGLIGIVSDRDIRSAVGFDAKLNEHLRVSEIMTDSPRTIALHEGFDNALAMLIENNFNALPVMNKKQLVGIITRRDLLRAFMRILGLDRDGRCIEIALPNQPEDLHYVFKTLESLQTDVISAVVSPMRSDGDEPTLYLRVGGVSEQKTEKALRNAGIIVLAPEQQ